MQRSLMYLIVLALVGTACTLGELDPKFVLPTERRAKITESAEAYAVNLRFTNCYGVLSDHKGSAVHKFVRKVLAGDPISVYGDGTQTRDFIYVEDICRAILAASSRSCAPVLQIGTGIETSVNEMLSALEEAVGHKIEVAHEAARLGDVMRSVCDNRLAGEQLGWRPRIELREGLKRVVDYYRPKVRGGEG